MIRFFSRNICTLNIKLMLCYFLYFYRLFLNTQLDFHPSMLAVVEMTVNTSIYYFEYVILTVKFLKVSERFSCTMICHHQRCLKTRETHKLCQQLQTVHQLLCCAQVEMRGLFYLNYIYIQFLSSKMRGAFDFIGLLNIFQFTDCNKRSLSCFPRI